MKVKQQMLSLEERGIILDAAMQPHEGRISFFTSLCRLQSGTILCGCQSGPGKHAANSTIRLSRSSDDGRTWELLPIRFSSCLSGIPGSLGAAELVETRPGRLLLFATWFDRSDPNRPLFDPVTQGILKSKQLLAVSEDDGNTWSDWREVQTAGLQGCALTGPVIRWPDGRIAVAFESFKEYDDPRPGRHAAWIMVSEDEGETFCSPLLVAQHPQHRVYYWDQRLCVGNRPGEFTALFWTHDLIGQRDLTVHRRQAQLEDGRIQESAIVATTLPGQIAAPVCLDDGSLLAFVVDRGQPCTMTLWYSPDAGQTWPAGDCLVVYQHNEQAAVTQGRENIDFRQYWEDMGRWSFGHPALQRLSRDRILLAWYAGTPDCMSLHWARVELRGGTSA